MFWGVKLRWLIWGVLVVDKLHKWLCKIIIYNCMNMKPCKKKSKLDTFVAVLLCFGVVWGILGVFRGGLGCFHGPSCIGYCLSVVVVNWLISPKPI